MSEIYIKLTRNQVAIIDEDDNSLINQRSWQYHWHGYAVSHINNKTILMHRLIMNFPKGSIDHINGNKLDNRKQNLRIATVSQNGANRKLNTKSKSGFKGVTWNKRKRKWSVVIIKEKKKYFLGYYYDPVEGAKVYDKKAKELFNEYARLNFPELPIP